MTLISTLRERRSWSILQHPLDVQVDVLVVETEQVFNLRALWKAPVRTAWTQHSRWQIGRTTELTSADENGRTLQGPAL